MRAAVALALLLNACAANVRPRIGLCDFPEGALAAFVQTPPLTIENWRSACVEIGFHVAMQ